MRSWRRCRCAVDARAVSRLRRAVRWSWKLAVGAVVGAGLGVGAPYALAVCGMTTPDHPFVLGGEVPAGSDFSLALYQTVGLRLAPGHTVTLLDNGAVFDAVVADVARAKRSIHVVMYIWEAGTASDRISTTLVERARAGVSCRLVIDAFGSSKFETTVQPALVAAGCEVRMFRPLPGADPLARNHRKLFVIDGAVAITGGFGVRDNWLGDGVTAEAWRDANVRFTGPAVADAQQRFAENWQETGGALLTATDFPEPLAPSAPPGLRAAFVASTASPVVTIAERLTQLMIVASRRRLWIANAYFAPSPAILDLIERKARAGVDVRILVPGAKSDSKPALAAQHAIYPRLREAGVQIFEYQPSMVHSKTMLVDDDLAIVGTTNFDPLSLNKLDEAMLVVQDPGFAAQLGATFATDCTHAVRR